LAAAKELRGAVSYRDLDHEEGVHTVRDIHWEVAVDAEAVRDVARRQRFQKDEEGSGMSEDRVAEDRRMDGCSTQFVLAFLQVHSRAGSVGDEQYWKQYAEDLDGGQE